MTKPADEDLPLVQRARSGDYTAFEALVGKYERRIFTLAMRIVKRQHDAEEVVQQTFLNVIEHIEEFREEAEFATWLTRIATNEAAGPVAQAVHAAGGSRTTRATRRRAIPTFPIPSSSPSGARLPTRSPRRGLGGWSTKRLGHLDDKYRLVFVLRDVEGLSTAETAEALKITPSNVKVRLLRARLMLRERLTHLFGDASTQVAGGGHDHD